MRPRHETSIPRTAGGLVLRSGGAGRGGTGADGTESGGTGSGRTGSGRTGPGETSPGEALAELRGTIRAIERVAAFTSSGPVEARPGWTLGAIGGAFDASVGGELDGNAVHEIKPVAGAEALPAAVAARRFALGLAVRRLLTSAPARSTAPVLWCTSTASATESGRAYGPGLAALGLDPARLVLVEAARAGDVLWALEEGLKSRAVALVIGEVGDVGLTPARRLALAAAASATPCLLLTSSRSSSVAATATRWRIAPAPSAPDAFDRQAPGAARCRIWLERRRRPSSGSGSGETVAITVEWNDVESCFRVVAGVADRSSAAHVAAEGLCASLGDHFPGRRIRARD